MYFLIIVFILLIIILIFYINSFSNVHIVKQKQIDKISLRKSDSDETIEISRTTDLRIKKGDYIVITTGENLETLQKDYNVEKNNEVLKPDFQFNSEYLDKEYKKEKEEIFSKILEKYPNLPELYEFKNDKLYSKGDIFASNLEYKNKKDDNKDTLKILLKKEKGEWQILSKPPQISLSKLDYKNIDSRILKDINRAQ